MKKILILMILVGCGLNQTAQANDEIQFQITFDSQEKQFVDIKNNLLNLINTALAHVDEKSIPIILSGDLSSLRQENQEVIFKNNTLFFQLGDSKGKKITGNIENNSFCMVEVKPKSLIRKWLDFLRW